MQHVQYGYEGSSIQRWDLEHGIVSVVRDGVEYRSCVDWQRFQEKCEQDAERHFKQRVAEQQEKAYL